MMNKQTGKYFTTRFGLLMSALGVAVGTGNIWRFPRIAAQNGGESGAGALIISWLVLLFVWSIPLIIAEYIIGKKYRRGAIADFKLSVGDSKRWMGGFVAIVAIAISFFYAVIVAWALYYLYYFIFNQLPETVGENQLIWENFQAGKLPALFHLLVVVIGAGVVWKGIKSIEKVNNIIIPVLLVIIIFSFVRIVFLDGAFLGIKYLFTPQWDQLLDARIWLQALTQNAWDTGAGWGLFLTYAAYMKYEQGTVKNAYLTGIGNNVISLVMAMVIFGTVFSVFGKQGGHSQVEVVEVMKTSGPASTGLTFIWIPQLFGTLAGGRILAILFFMGLSFAGFSSLISMYELSAKVLSDYGFSRRKSVITLIVISYLAGIPSALSADFLSNQDFVWGLGLIVSGVFIALAIRKMGLEKMRLHINSFKNDWNLSLRWTYAIQYVVPVAGVVLIVWWMIQSVLFFDPDNWYNPIKPYSLLTVLVQWGIVLLLLIVFNKNLTRRN